ncbi:MAG: M14 family zinc carboxypeptidase [Polyangiaceae bacterium]
MNKEQWKRVFNAYAHLLDIDDVIDDLHRQYPDKTEIVQIGTSTEGRAIKAVLVADDPKSAHDRPSMLLNAAHHGDEPLSSDIVLDAMETLLKPDSDARVKRYLSEFQIWCVPMVNPDGIATFMQDFGAGRKNGRETRKLVVGGTLNQRGVDLNRNYPFRWGALREEGSTKNPERRNYRGPEPASEPETRAMMALSEQQHFVGSISYHIGTVALLAPYTIDGVPEPVPNEAWPVAEEIARATRPDKTRPLYVHKNLYPVDGTDQDYFRFTQGTLALLFEAAHRSWETPLLHQQTLDAVRPAWGVLFNRYLEGPSVEGRVKDDKGRPVSADVKVVEVKTNAGEVWKSRCPDGFYGRYLPAFGKYTLRVTPDGGAPIDVPFESAQVKGRAIVDVTIPAQNGASAKGGCAK